MNSLRKYLFEQTSIAPLAVFRIIFGFMMLFSVIRFAMNGWITALYVEPEFYFPFYGFGWVKPLGDTGMHLVFLLMGIAAFMIMIGFFYRISAVVFFLSFTYVELIDKTNYLNHYYFVSIVAFLLILLPAHRSFSIDAKIFPAIRLDHVPRWTITALQLQLAMVYFFAGVAKLEYSWLIEAQPLRIWLPANAHLPVIGSFLDEVWVAYFFSWFGCIYDLTIPFFLSWKKTRSWAYLAVIAFHVLTRMMFNIGMFPWIMILSTLIFFPADLHEEIIAFLKRTFAGKIEHTERAEGKWNFGLKQKLVFSLLLLHFTIQGFLPFRYLLYPGELFWHEEGFRFSWRVMLMEKGGTALFYVSDPALPGSIEINNRDYLTAQQEKMMSTQPDMILQFAHHLRDQYRNKSIRIREEEYVFRNPEVRVRSYVSLNGSGAREFIDPDVNLAALEYNLQHRPWVKPYQP